MLEIASFASRLKNSHEFKLPYSWSARLALLISTLCIATLNYLCYLSNQCGSIIK